MKTSTATTARVSSLHCRFCDMVAVVFAGWDVAILEGQVAVHDALVALAQRKLDAQLSAPRLMDWDSLQSHFERYVPQVCVLLYD